MESKITIVNDEERFSSPTLREICISFCAFNAKSLLLEPSKGIKGKPSKLTKNAVLPNKMWEELLDNADRKSRDYVPLVISINDKTSNGLRKLNFSGCTKLADSDLKRAMQGYPTSVDIHGCPSLTKKALGILLEFGKNLESLEIGNSSHILPTDIEGWILALGEDNKGHRYQGLIKSITRLFKKNEPETPSDEFDHGLLQLPKLRKIVIWNLHVTQMQQIKLPNQTPPESETAETTAEGASNSGVLVTVDYWEYLMRDFLHNLEYLDLSGCQELSNLNFLIQAKDKLRTLRLHDVLLDYDERTWGVLRNLPKVTFLDVSQYSELASVFPDPDTVLENLVTSLPNLSALDISGTNLAGFNIENARCGIRGLSSRMDTPLNFLGLLTTHHHASNRNNIPALKIAGGADMEQIVMALKHYLPQATMSKKVIRILQEKLIGSRQTFAPCRTLIRLLYQVTRIHRDDKHILIIAIASMYHLLKRICDEVDGVPVGDAQLHRIAESILEIMKVYKNDTNLLRNGILIFLLITEKLDLKNHLTLAEDLAMTLLAMGKHMIFIFSTDAQMEFFRESISRLLGHMLDLGPEVEGRLQNLKVMRALCDLISGLMDQKLFSHLPIFWSILYRVADCCDRDSTDICDLFLQTDGVKLCFQYLKVCEDEDTPDNGVQSPEALEVQINVLALLTNLVCIPEGESMIVKDPHIESVLRITERDFPPGERKEMLLHVACGLLANVASKTSSNSLVSPPRSEILAKITELMTNVDFEIPIDLTFRNLTMLYEMLESCDAPEVHLWALKTIVCLLNAECEPHSNTDGAEKYGGMLAEDKKLTVKRLDEICRNAPLELKTEIHRLANCVITEILRIPN